MADKEIEQEAFGPNIWLVDDMYRRYQENPKSVGESWQDFFEDDRPDRATPRRADPQDSSNGGASKEKKPKDEGMAKSDGGSKGGSAVTQTKGSDDQPKEEKKSSDDESSKADEGAGEVEDATPLRGIAAGSQRTWRRRSRFRPRPRCGRSLPSSSRRIGASSTATSPATRAARSASRTSSAGRS